MNLFTAGLTVIHPRSFDTLIGGSPNNYIYTQLAVAALAVTFALALRYRPALWLYWSVAVWGAIEAMPWVTSRIYAHAAVFPLSLVAALFAIQGLRGALALRRLSASQL